MPQLKTTKFLKKMFLCIICTAILEFVEAKFNICSTFYEFTLDKNKNLYSLHYV